MESGKGHSSRKMPLQVEVPVPIAFIKNYGEEDVGENIGLPTTSHLGHAVGDIVTYHGRIKIVAVLCAKNNVAKLFPLREDASGKFNIQKKNSQIVFLLSIQESLPVKVHGLNSFIRQGYH